MKASALLWVMLVMFSLSIVFGAYQIKYIVGKTPIIYSSILLSYIEMHCTMNKIQMIKILGCSLDEFCLSRMHQLCAASNVQLCKKALHNVICNNIQKNVIVSLKYVLVWKSNQHSCWQQLKQSGMTHTEIAINNKIEFKQSTDSSSFLWVHKIHKTSKFKLTEKRQKLSANEKTFHKLHDTA